MSTVRYLVFYTSEVFGLTACVDYPWTWVVYKDRRIVAAGQDVCSEICAEAAEKVAIKMGMPTRHDEEFRKRMGDEVCMRIPPYRCPKCGGSIKRAIVDGTCYY